MRLIRETYFEQIRPYYDLDIIKVITVAYVKIGLNQEKSYKIRV